MLARYASSGFKIGAPKRGGLFRRFACASYTVRAVKLEMREERNKSRLMSLQVSFFFAPPPPPSPPLSGKTRRSDRRDAPLAPPRNRILLLSSLKGLSRRAGDHEIYLVGGFRRNGSRHSATRLLDDDPQRHSALVIFIEPIGQQLQTRWISNKLDQAMQHPARPAPLVSDSYSPEADGTFGDIESDIEETTPIDPPPPLPSPPPPRRYSCNLESKWQKGQREAGSRGIIRVCRVLQRRLVISVVAAFPPGSSLSNVCFYTFGRHVE